MHHITLVINIYHHVSELEHAFTSWTDSILCVSKLLNTFTPTACIQMLLLNGQLIDIQNDANMTQYAYGYNIILDYCNYSPYPFN